MNAFVTAAVAGTMPTLAHPEDDLDLTPCLARTMNEAPVELGPGRFRAIQRAVCATARVLAREHGQHQFYTLSQVQSQAATATVDDSLLAWVYAVFVTRDDFEAYFAVRETPGTYRQLRVAMTPETRSVPDPTSGAVSDDAWADCRDELDELAQWLVRSTDLT